MKRRLLLSSALGAVSLGLPAQLSAQSAKEFSTLRFYQAVGQGNFLGVDGTRIGSHLATTYGAYFDFSADTLTEKNPCSALRDARSCDSGERSFLPATGMLHLTGSVALADRVEVSLDVPLGFTDGNTLFYQAAPEPGQSSSREVGPRDGFAFGDTRVRAKTPLWSSPDEAYSISAAAFTSLPTGMITSHGDCKDPKQCSYVGERGLNAGGYAIAEARVHDFRFAANVGAAYRPSRRYLDNRIGTELLYGVAGEYQPTPLVRVLAELVGAANLIGGKDFPVEARGALGYGDELSVLVGGGAGLNGDLGSPAFRIFAGARYTPVFHDADQDGLGDDVDACPTAVEDRDGFNDGDGCPEFDNDNDGVPDGTDKCKNDPEDKDGFEDEDGCPELDNDGDGVPDGYDSCEGQKEDLDGDRDDDGCPDFDTDRDGLRDDIDKCPEEAEDRDGLADDDGCPEADFDGDGLHDPEDACPDQMESWNGVLDQDGCPEDDTDKDSVPDQTDACPDQPETLNGKADDDGCPDGVAIVSYERGAIRSAQALEFDGVKLVGDRPLLNTITSFVQRAHRGGGLHVVLVSDHVTSEADAQLTRLVGSIAARLPRKITSELKKGAPAALIVELRP
jgi:OmpA-OmpF porin, OOP family